MPTSTLSGEYQARTGLAATFRTDRWWVEPLWTGVGFLLLRRLLHLGGVPGRSLLLRRLSVALLFAAAVHRPDATRRRAPSSTPGSASGRTGCAPSGRRSCPPRPAVADPRRPALLPPHLLLLPQVLLPRVLPDAAGLRGRRAAAAQLPRRDRAASCSRTCTATRSTSRSAIIVILSYDAYLALLARRHDSASASAPSC